ncbi:MAG: hypothetical protein ABSG44_02850 [Thermodesulfobacteriota bacterium]|jgi:hypothetical protein
MKHPPIGASGSFLSTFILFVRGLSINTRALETPSYPQMRDKGDNERVAA